MADKTYVILIVLFIVMFILSIILGDPSSLGGPNIPRNLPPAPTMPANPPPYTP